MINFFKSLFLSPEERAMHNAKKYIKKMGGARTYLMLFNSIIMLKGHKEKIFSGVLLEEEFLEDPHVVSIASIHCMMDVRKRLVQDPENASKLNELILFEELFIISVLMQLKVKDFFDPEFAADIMLSLPSSEENILASLKLTQVDANDKRHAKAREALKKWREYDSATFVGYVDVD